MAKVETGGKKRAHRIGMCALAVVVLCGVVLMYLTFAFPYAAKGAQPLLTGWRYFTDDAPEPVNWPVIDGYIQVSPGRSITLMRTMTEDIRPASLLLHLDFLQAEVSLGGRVLFSNEFDPPGEDKGISDRIVALPDGYTGQELTVTVSSPYELYSFSPDVIWLGDADALRAKVMGNAFSNVAMMVTLVLSGLALMAFSLATRGGWDGFLFGVASVIYGLWLPGQGGAYLGAFSPRFAAQLQYATFHLYVVPMLWFLWMRCKRTRRPALILAIVYSAISIPMMGVMCLGVIAPPDTLVIMNPAIIGASLCMFMLCLIEWLQKNPFFRMTAPAFLALASVAILSLIDIQGFYTPKDILNVGGLLLLVVLVWVDIIRTYLNSRRHQAEEMQLLQLKGQMALEQFEAAAQRNHETHLLRHEIRHHLAALSVLQREGNLTGMGQYLDKLSIQAQVQDTVQYCVHPLANAILTRTAADCAREGIRFACEADVPSGLPIEETDLASLLLNMIENAVEAAVLVPEGTRWITIKLAQKEGFLVVNCQNARGGLIEQVGEHFKTTKSDTHRHGYGIPAMRQVAERYGGKLNINYDDNSFTVKTILRLAS